MTEPSIIERVAKAICEGSGDYCFQREVTSASGNCVTCLNQARAAIAAMREPTELMCAAGGVMIAMNIDKPAFDYASIGYKYMIDAALKETA